MATNLRDNDPQETQEWLDSISAVIRAQGMDRAQFLLKSLINKATESGQQLPVGSLTTPYRNTIPVSEEPKMPGDLYTERAVRAVIRWNALAMVMRANKLGLDLGGGCGLHHAERRFDRHQKYPSCFFFSMEAEASLSMTRPWRSEEVATSISSTMSRSVVALESMAPVSG